MPVCEANSIGFPQVTVENPIDNHPDLATNRFNGWLARVCETNPCMHIYLALVALATIQAHPRLKGESRRLSTVQPWLHMWAQGTCARGDEVTGRGKRSFPNKGEVVKQPTIRLQQPQIPATPLGVNPSEFDILAGSAALDQHPDKPDLTNRSRLNGRNPRWARVA